jgi:hypothetical protein
MKIYIAGPMRGLPLYNFPAFMAAAERIRAFGHTPVNPAERDIVEDGFDPAKDEAKPFRFYMRHDLPLVMDCDAVAVLPGWEKSKGASLEVHVARECEIPIFEMESLEPFLK